MEQLRIDSRCFGLPSSVCLIVLLRAPGVAKHYLHKFNWDEISTSQNRRFTSHQIKMGIHMCISARTHVLPYMYVMAKFSLCFIAQ